MYILINWVFVKMQVNNSRGTTLLFCILIVIIITISYYEPSKQLPTLFIYAEKDKKMGRQR